MWNKYIVVPTKLIALIEVICLQCTSNPNRTIYAHFLSDMCNASVQPHFCFGWPNWGLSQTYVFSRMEDICSSGRGSSWLSSFDIHCVLLEFSSFKKKIMQCVQRVYNLPVSVDQQTRPDWKYSSAYCWWTWTGEVQKLWSTLSKTDTFQSSTRCWPERGVVSLLIYRISYNNHPPPFWWKYLN